MLRTKWFFLGAFPRWFVSVDKTATNQPIHHGGDRRWRDIHYTFLMMIPQEWKSTLQNCCLLYSYIIDCKTLDVRPMGFGRGLSCLSSRLVGLDWTRWTRCLQTNAKLQPEYGHFSFDRTVVCIQNNKHFASIL